MKTASIEKWTWVLIYGGLLTLGLGLAVRASAAGQGLGLGLMIGGGIVTGLGVVLIYIRSRMKSDTP